ncbi:MAG: adenylate/guanylate cyclase domain-containing protein [Gallionella sp.]
MDKTIFVRTSKGEDEMRNKTAHLSVDIKRTLLMVDGISSIREISRRVAPSLRASLGDIFKELLKDGYIVIKSKSNVLNLSQAKSGAAAKMTMQTKISNPALKSVNDGLNELDFASGFVNEEKNQVADTPEVHNLIQDDEKFRAEIKARVEAEFREEIKARVEAELRAEAKAQEEAELKQRLLDEAKAIDDARALAEERARLEAKAQAEAKAAAIEKARIEDEAKALAEEKARIAAAEKARIEAETKAREEARLRAEAEAKALAEEKARIAAVEKVRAEAEAKAREEARLRAEAEAKALAEEKARIAAAEKARVEAEAKAREEARLRAEAEAKAIAEEKARIEAEIRAEAKARVEAETKKRIEEARQLAEAQAKQEAEIKSLALAKARAEAEVQAIAEAKARIEAEIRAEAKAQIVEENKIRKEIELAGLKARFAADKLTKNDPLTTDVREKLLELTQEKVVASEELPVAKIDSASEGNKTKFVVTPSDRSTSATVLFFDVVGYTKLSGNKQLDVKAQFNRLVSTCLAAQGEDERLILDTGDGAAIGFMQHPEDALEVAMQFRNALIANQHNDYPELKVRIGIHIGPVTIVKDMNGQSNMVGDGINDAQRVMNFAGTDQIFISRAYHEFISRLNEQYGDMFYYQGAQKDKHNREHHVYKLVDVVAPVNQKNASNVVGESTTVKLEPFSFDVDDEIVKAVSGKKPASKPVRQPVEVSQEPIEHLPSEAVAESQAVFESEPAPEVDAPAYSQSEINNLEQEQARLWQNAEQEAIAAAKASTLRIVQPQSEVPHPVKNNRPRARRESIPWSKVAMGFMLVIIATLFIAPYVLPTQGLISKVEQSLTKKFQQPVHIGGVEGRLLPTPRLDLLDVSVGELNQVTTQRARANFSILTLLSNSKTIRSLELEGAHFDGTALQVVSAWIQNAVADKSYPIAKILLNDSKLEGNGIQLNTIGGEFNFNKDGSFKVANLHANGHKLALVLEASSGEKVKVVILAHSSAMPLLPNWVFDDFVAKGEMINGVLEISEIESHIAKGLLRGKARINWNAGWSVEGSLAAKNIASQNLSGGLSGDIEGTARFQMRAAELGNLSNGATMDGSLMMNKGIINGIDIVETATRRSTENLPGGRTHFDELWSDFSFANDTYNFRQLKIKAGVMTAKGVLDVSKQQLSGRITADMALRSDNMGSIPMQVGGNTDNPTLKMVR